MEAPLPDHEAARLAALRHYQILDTEPEVAFDDLTRLAAHICGTPIALISLVDEHRQWFKSRVGISITQTPLAVSFCAHAILEPTPLIVSDALEDARFATNPSVTGEPWIRFYAGFPLVTAQGYSLGTLCVLDRVPRVLSLEQVTALQALARQVMTHLELRGNLVALAQTMAEREQAETEVRSLNTQLEQRVLERTAQLHLANRLKDELLLREQTARREAEATNRLKDEFLAVISHELRTPLSAILGWAELLRTGQLDAATSADALETIEHSALAQVQLIEDLLDVSRAITGKLPLKAWQVNLVPVIEAALAAVTLAAEAKSIHVEAILDPEAGLVLGDADRLQQVVWNLLSNAIKFTPQGGQVRVRLERCQGQVEISVQDTGQGIPQEFLPHVFDRFRQADSTSTRAYGGLGLGLAVVRHLVETHGGSVEAASAGQGQGATFTIRLPLAEVNSSPQHPETFNLDVWSRMLLSGRTKNG